MKKLIVLSTLLIVFMSCNGTKNTSKKTTAEIVSGKYEIRDVEGSTNVYKLYFEINTSENSISGKTGCNGFSGNYTISENNITFLPFISTKMYCEEHVMKVEKNIFKAFSGTKKFTFDNNMLTLINEDGTVSLKAYKENKNNK